MRRSFENIPTQALEALTNYAWPVKIREPQNVVERSVISSNGPEFHVAVPEPSGASAPVARRSRASNRSEAADHARIMQALKEAQGIVGGRDGGAPRLARSVRLCSTACGSTTSHASFCEAGELPQPKSPTVHVPRQ